MLTDQTLIVIDPMYKLPAASSAALSSIHDVDWYANKICMRYKQLTFTGGHLTTGIILFGEWQKKTKCVLSHEALMRTQVRSPKAEQRQQEMAFSPFLPHKLLILHYLC